MLFSSLLARASGELGSREFAPVGCSLEALIRSSSPFVSSSCILMAASFWASIAFPVARVFAYQPAARRAGRIIITHRAIRAPNMREGKLGDWVIGCLGDCGKAG